MLAALNEIRNPSADTVSADRRAHPRLSTTRNALIRLSSALTFRCTVRNISIAATQVACDPRYALLIHPRGGPIAPAMARTLELSIALPIHGTVRGFTSRCRILYCEPSASDSMLLGLQFVELDWNSKPLLASFLGASREY